MHILFVPGVFAEDCRNAELPEDEDHENTPPDMVHWRAVTETDLVDDIASGVVFESNHRLPGERTIRPDFDPPPKQFTSAANWITSTNLLCCYCHMPIQGQPFPIPTRQTRTIEQRTETISFLLLPALGCDAVCAGNYIKKIEDPRISNKRESLAMVLALHRLLTGCIITGIPDRELWRTMRQYCGDGPTPTEYRRSRIESENKLRIAFENLRGSI